MTIETLTAYLVAAFLAWAPPHCGPDEHPSTHQCRVYRTFKDAEESRDETVARYHELANAIALVVLDETEKPIVGGRHARERTAVLLGATAYFESGFRRDVALGLGPFAKGDSGASWTYWQVRLDRRGYVTTAEGWTGPELVEDTTKAATVGLHFLQRAVSTCRGDLASRLTLYRWGKCMPADENARARVGLAERWVSAHPFD